MKQAKWFLLLHVILGIYAAAACAASWPRSSRF